MYLRNCLWNNRTFTTITSGGATLGYSLSREAPFSQKKFKEKAGITNFVHNELHNVSLVHWFVHLCFLTFFLGSKPHNCYFFILTFQPSLFICWLNSPYILQLSLLYSSIFPYIMAYIHFLFSQYLFIYFGKLFPSFYF